MKNKILTILAGALVAFSFPACDTLSKITKGVSSVTSAGSATLSPATASKIVVAAEKSIREAKDTIDTFLHLEYNHKDFVKKNFPVIHQAAETLRRSAPDALLAADKVKNTFKHNRTTENQADLMTAVATVTKLAGEAKAYTKQLNGTP
jgi:hypothetical protein